MKRPISKSKLEKNDEESKKTAIKLVNQYADSYKIVEKENKLLSQEIQDLKMSLQISKTMITDLLSNLKLNLKEKSIIDGLKQEIDLLSKSLDYYKKENSEIKSIYSTASIDLNQSKYQKQIDNLSNKVFLLENSIAKKDMQMKQMTKKLNDSLFYKELDGSIFIKETYLIDPQVTVNLIHEDLLLYKHVYEKISVNFKDLLTQNKQLENVIDNLRLENSKLNNLIKNLKCSGTHNQKQVICKIFNLAEFYENFKDRSHGYNDYLNEDMKTSSAETTINTQAKNSKLKENTLEEIQEQGELESEDDSFNYDLYSPIAVNFPDKIVHKSTKDDFTGMIPTLDLSKTKNSNYKIEKKEDKCKTNRITKKIKAQINEEWEVSIKYAGLTLEELERLCKNKFLYKLFDAMLNLNRIIEEKNCLLQSAISKLKSAQGDKQKKEQENIELYQKIISIREEVELLMNNSKKKKKNDKNESSFVCDTLASNKMTENSMINNPHDASNISIFSEKNTSLILKTEDDLNEERENSDRSNVTEIRMPNSEKQRNILNDINDLHSSMIKEHEEIREYLQTEALNK